MTELLPCPFCCGEAVAFKSTNAAKMTDYRVRCRGCCAVVLGWADAARATVAWNTRIEPDGDPINFMDRRIS